MKEKRLFVDNGEIRENRSEPYVMPDCSEVSCDYGNVSEMIFTTEGDFTSIQDTFLKSMKNFDKEDQTTYLKNIIINGGNTRINGFSKRLTSELQAKVPSGV
jgi:actin-related protein